MEGVLGRLRRLDAYPRTVKEYEVRTVGGAFVSVFGIIIMALLFFGELMLYLNMETVHEMSVDASRGEKLLINVNVTFPAMPCAVISIDTMDITGEQHLDVSHEVYKQRLDSSGQAVAVPEREHDLHSNKTAIKEALAKGGEGQGDANANTQVVVQPGTAECGSCYGADTEPGQCCNSCDSVREAYRKKGWALMDLGSIKQCKEEGATSDQQIEAHEGCNIHGTLEVNKVAGNFHFSAGKSFNQVSISAMGLISFQRTNYNVSHVINHLSFGRKYPGRENPLDQVNAYTHDESVMYQYFLKVVPTTYHFLNGTKLDTNQFSTTENRRTLDAFQRGLPGVFFFYDLSPIMVTFKETKSSFLHFLTGVCAIVGGVFTVASMVDSGVWEGQKLAEKIRLGKQS